MPQTVNFRTEPGAGVLIDPNSDTFLAKFTLPDRTFRALGRNRRNFGWCWQPVFQAPFVYDFFICQAQPRNVWFLQMVLTNCSAFPLT